MRFATYKEKTSLQIDRQVEALGGCCQGISSFNSKQCRDFPSCPNENFELRESLKDKEFKSSYLANFKMPEGPDNMTSQTQEPEKFLEKKRKSPLRENYLDILVSACDQLVKDGLVDQETNSDCEDNSNESKINESKSASELSQYLRCSNKHCFYFKQPLFIGLLEKICEKGKVFYYCNDCVSAYRNKQYCYFCNTLYKDNTAESDDNIWIQCENCKNWVYS